MMAFSSEFQTELLDLMRWRRDVRRFRSDPVDDALLRDCLEAMRLAPSVGLSEPWRVISVQSETARDAMLANFQAENADALADYDGERAETYAGLKLSGMREAPVQLAVFCDEDTSKGGRMQLAAQYIVVMISKVSTRWTLRQQLFYDCPSELGQLLKPTSMVVSQFVIIQTEQFEDGDM